MDGTAKYYYKSGAVETRIYENGVLQVIIMSSSYKHGNKVITYKSLSIYPTYILKSVYARKNTVTNIIS